MSKKKDKGQICGGSAASLARGNNKGVSNKDYDRITASWYKKWSKGYLNFAWACCSQADKIGHPMPMGLASLKFPFGEVQLNYCGNGLFSLLDLKDPYYGKPHGYPKHIGCYMDNEGKLNAEAFCQEILRECDYIRRIHENGNENNPQKFIVVDNTDFSENE